MGYEILAFGKEGEMVASFYTHHEDHRAAHAMMGALGVSYNYLDQAGDGDTLKFTKKELSAAQEALIVAVNTDEEFSRGLIFLDDCVEYMQKNDMTEIEIGFF